MERKSHIVVWYWKVQSSALGLPSLPVTFPSSMIWSKLSLSPVFLTCWLPTQIPICFLLESEWAHLYTALSMNCSSLQVVPLRYLSSCSGIFLYAWFFSTLNYQRGSEPILGKAAMWLKKESIGCSDNKNVFAVYLHNWPNDGSLFITSWMWWLVSQNSNWSGEIERENEHMRPIVPAFPSSIRPLEVSVTP